MEYTGKFERMENMKKLSILSCVLLLAMVLLASCYQTKEDASDKEQGSEIKVSAEEIIKSPEEKADVTATPLDSQLGPLRDTTFDIKTGNAPNTFDSQWQFSEHKFFDVEADKTSTPKTSKTSEEK
jgi:hypothetical protein